MGWNYYGYKPYVPVAERRRKALRELEKMSKKGFSMTPVVINGRVIARTFWGKSWCENLESYSDFSNRLPRGRTYVCNGSVVHLEIQAGKISAKVSGSQLYSVEIKIASLPDPHWKAVKSQCSGQIGSMIELLQGKLSQAVMDIVTKRGAGLFPKPAEIKMSCSCPDYAGMCKHIAAVMYGVGARLDDKPELLFVLRQVDHLELIAGAVDSPSIASAAPSRGKKTIAAGDIADVFGIEMTEADIPAEAAPTVTARTPTEPRVAAAKTGSKTKPKQAASAKRSAASVNAAPVVVPKAGVKSSASGRKAKAVSTQPAGRTITAKNTKPATIVTSKPKTRKTNAIAPTEVPSAPAKAAPRTRKRVKAAIV